MIGNGMAGARTVEEILARGGGEQFAITMFGDEPYGNYNRIMLHVLSGEESDDDIFLNTMEWYVENDITLHAGVRVDRIDRFAKRRVRRRRLGHPVRPADHRHRQPRVHAADGRACTAPRLALLPGVFAFRTLDDTRAMVDYAHARRPSPAVVIGGGLLGLEAARGLQSHGHRRSTWCTPAST